MNNTLVVCYTGRRGNTDDIGRNVGGSLQSDVLETGEMPQEN